MSLTCQLWRCKLTTERTEDVLRSHLQTYRQPVCQIAGASCKLRQCHRIRDVIAVNSELVAPTSAGGVERLNQEFGTWVSDLDLEA